MYLSCVPAFSFRQTPRRKPLGAAGRGAHGLGPVLRHAGQRAALRAPIVEEKEAGERRFRCAPATRAAGKIQLGLLAGPPRHAGDLEGVRVVAQRQQLVAAAERHAGGRVEVPARVAAGVVDLVCCSSSTASRM